MYLFALISFMSIALSKTILTLSYMIYRNFNHIECIREKVMLKSNKCTYFGRQINNDSYPK